MSIISFKYLLSGNKFSFDVFLSLDLLNFSKCNYKISGWAMKTFYNYG